MGNRKILSAVIVSALGVALFVTAALLTRGGSSALAQGDPSGRESSAPVDGTAVGGPGTMPEEEAIDPAEFGADASATLADFRVAGSVLRPRADDVSYQPAPVGTGGGCLYASGGFADRIFNTPVYLPQGSKVVVTRMYYDDTSSSNSRAWFSVYNLYGELVEEWAVDSVGNSGRGLNDTEQIDHFIDYASYSYVLNWRPNDLGSDMQLCGFRIFYEPPPFGVQFLPNVIKP